MKRLICLLSVILAIGMGSVYAKKIFVEMEYDNHRIKLNDGLSDKFHKVKNEDGKDIKFNSIIGALNYMSLQGWELIGNRDENGTGTSFHYGTVSTMLSDSKCYYIFCKDVSDEEIKSIVERGFRK